MRRIPVALTVAESAALYWLKHFATEPQLPPDLRPYRKFALHLAIKALSAAQLADLCQAHAAAVARIDGN